MTMYLSTSNYLSGLPRWLSGKESACSAGDMGSIPGSGKSPWEGNNPLQYLCLGNSKDRGALVGYRPWGCKRVGCDLETRQQQQESIYLPTYVISHQFSSVQLLSHVWLFATPWTTACQASLSITNFRSSPKLMSIESVMPSNHLILCHPLLLLPSIFPSIRVFSNESALHIRWPKYWSFNWASVLPVNTQD